MRPIYRCVEDGETRYVEDPRECRGRAVLLVDGQRRLRLSKLVSALLRHIPHEAGIRLDREGWVSIEELVRGIRERWRNREAYRWVTPEHIVALALLDPKGRFQLDQARGRIRAAYGHSVRVELGYQPVPWSQAPERLYHGTTRDRLRSIMEKGLLPMRRLMVHLSSDPETAVEVGRRHGGDVVVLVVDVDCLRRHGIPLYRASSRIYLAPHVPPSCLRVQD